MGGRDLRVGGGAESEARKRKRNRAVQQKKSYDAAKKSCHSTREVEQCGKKWRVPERSGAIRGKSWALPNESSLVFAKSFRFFCHPWEGTRAGRDFKEAGCGDRTEGWRACEEDRLPRMKKWDDEERHVTALWIKGGVGDCLRGAFLWLLRRREERSALWAVLAGEGVRPVRTRTNEKRRLHE